MRFPKRIDTHVMETDSWTLLRTHAPDTWIPRDVSERDYGIDAYIEIAAQNGDITGNLISGQLKSVRDEIKWAGDEHPTARSPSIDTATAAYWFHLPVPVFLFVADLSARQVYYVSVEREIRQNFAKLDTQQTMSFTLRKDLSIGTDVGDALFPWFVASERIHSRFVQHAINLLSRLTATDEFIFDNQMRDCFMEVELDQELEFTSIYQTMQAVALQLGIEWPVERLSELYKMDRQQWGDPYVRLHESTLDSALQKLESLLPKLLRGLIDLVTQKEPAYWKHTSPILFEACSSGEFAGPIKRIEERVARRNLPSRGR